MLTTKRMRVSWLIVLGIVGLSGCATVSSPRNPTDPWESYNRTMYKINDTLDKAVLKPVARGYKKVVPEFVRTGVNNFFGNLGDVAVTVNNVFQGKFGRAGSDAGRVLVNSTVGILGFIDVGSKVGLTKHNEDFGQTLGYWGTRPGPYLILPFLGPSTVRDGLGSIVDAPLSYWPYVDSIRARNIIYAIDSVKARAHGLDAETVLDEAALDPYAFTRDAYLQRRESLVHDGNPPKKLEDESEDEVELSPSKAPSGNNSQNGKRP